MLPMLEQEKIKFLVQKTATENVNLLCKLHGKDGADKTSVHDGSLEGSCGVVCSLL
jgi:hypothetical protein